MKGDKHETFDKILSELEPRLDKLGLITTDEAWKLCKVRWGYSTITTQFRKIMDMMVTQGKAKKIKNGKWEILKPNTPQKQN